MTKQHHIFSEERGEELVAYIYGEMDAAGRGAIEVHLENCVDCAIELASFADARLGVIEWRREDFDPLETPAISVPSVQVVGPSHFAGPGLIGTVAESLRSLPVFARFAAGIAAAAIIVAALYLGTASTPQAPQIVAAINDQSVTANAPLIGEQNSERPASTVTLDKHETAGPVAKTAKRRQSFSRPVTARTARHTLTGPVRKTETAATAPARVRRAPRLNSFEEDEDRSLRLSDLFAEIGSSDE